MLHLDQLTKHYDGHVVFQGLTHTFSPGCYALCEEQSTGKSSLLAIIAGELQPDGGNVVIDGHSLLHEPDAAVARVGYVPDNCMAFPEQTGRGLLEHVAATKNTIVDQTVLDLAYRLGLEPHLDKRFEQMSRGTRRKVFITAASIAHPAVVVADGPSNGLDAQGCVELAQLFKDWAQDRVVLLASHDVDLVRACEARPFDIANR